MVCTIMPTSCWMLLWYRCIFAKTRSHSSRSRTCLAILVPKTNQISPQNSIFKKQEWKCFSSLSQCYLISNFLNIWIFAPKIDKIKAICILIDVLVARWRCLAILVPKIRFLIKKTRLKMLFRSKNAMKTSFANISNIWIFAPKMNKLEAFASLTTPPCGHFGA